MSEKRTEPIKPNSIKTVPMKGLIVIDPIKIISNYERERLKKKPDVILTQEEISNYNKQIAESSKDVLKIWSEHPDQGVIVALHPDDAEIYELRVNDHIAYNHSEYTGILIVYKKKRYIALRPGEIIMRYLTDEV